MMYNIITIRCLVLFYLLATFTASIHSEEVALLDLTFKRTTDQDPNSTFHTAYIGCRVIINKPQDNRFNKDNLGATFIDKPVVSKQPTTDWLETALLGLDTLGIHTSKNQVTGVKNDILLSTKLNRLYIWNHGMRLYATIALEAKFSTLETGKELTKNYRIAGSKLNWWGADSEYATTLNISANRLIEQIAIDLSKQCAQEKSN